MVSGHIGIIKGVLKPFLAKAGSLAVQYLWKFADLCAVYVKFYPIIHHDI